MALKTSDEYFDLGNFSWKINTKNTEAQIWFDRGITWAYAFNHDEAVMCFRQVLAHDPDCLMGYWGIAYCSGPHYNKQWSAFDPNDLSVSYGRGVEALEKARYVVSATTRPMEQALIEAIHARFPPQAEAEQLKLSNELYASAMRKVYEEFVVDDLNVLVLAADALMNTAPWQLFESRTGSPNKSTPVVEIGKILDEGMKHSEANNHPCLLHLYIHYMEMSKTPEAALIPADRLRYLVPDSGHLQHMPSHIYLLIGDYRQAMDANLKATFADDKYWNVHPDTLFYTVYRLHNFHSLIYAAMLAGQSKVAVQACDRLEAALPEQLLRIESPPMADWVEAFHSVRMHVLIRFGMWDEIKRLAIPKDQILYCVTTSSTHYAKGIAFAATGHIQEAEAEQRLFRQTAAKVPESRLDFPNKVIDELSIADAMLEGEIAYRRGDYDTAFENLRLAIKRDDSLIYSEPWGWQVPTRHAYSALLLERGRFEEAAKVYAQDLGLDDSLASAHQHPNNIWSLRGYHECLNRLGRKDEARIIKQQLTIAIAIADIPIQASCFCSSSTMVPTSTGSGD